MWAWPRWRRTTLPFLFSTRALSLERRGRERVNSTRSLSSRRRPAVDVLEKLAAWVGAPDVVVYEETADPAHALVLGRAVEKLHRATI